MSSKSLSEGSSYLVVAKLLRPHGVRGEVFCHVFSGETSWLEQSSQWLLCRPPQDGPEKFDYLSSEELHQMDGPQKYTVEHCQRHKSGLIVRFSEITSRELAETACGQLVLISRTELRSQPGEPIYLHEVLGFQVFDSDRLQGSVVGFSSNGAQDLLVVEGRGGRFEVPFVEPLLQSIDFSKEAIMMELPEGLIPRR